METKTTFTGNIGPLTFPVFTWDGEVLTKNSLAIDIETEVIHDRLAIPRLALMTASSGDQHCMVHPDRCADFLLAHAGCDLIGQNIQFDWWGLHQHFTMTDRGDAIEALLQAGDEYRLHDVMLLDQLWLMGAFDFPPVPRDLGTIAQVHARLSIDKTDPFRKRYGEIINVDWRHVPDGFFHYAIRDAVATYATMAKLYAKCVKLAHEHHVDQRMIDRYGPLTEALQTNASIVFQQITRNGIEIDIDHLRTVRNELQAEIDQLVTQIEAMPGTRNLFKRKSDGSLIMTASGRPSYEEAKGLRPLLERIADELDLSPEYTTRGITTKRDFWEDYRTAHPFIEAFLDVGRVAKLREFALTTETRVHPNYTVLKKTGRTSSSKPNFQQVPRDPRHRSAFIASPGHVFVKRDYNAIELRMLAQICLDIYGKSSLADAFHRGEDPHSFLAATLLGVTLEEFYTLDDWETRRNRAKPFSFGVPGGMAAPTIIQQAKKSGVQLTEQEATRFRNVMINEAFPELKRYLDRDMAKIAADSLQTTREEVVRLFGDGPVLGAARRIVAGRPYTRRGRYYDEAFVDETWKRLDAVNRNPDLADLIHARNTQQLAKLIFDSPVVTRTGRIRAKASYCESCNYGFQALASDGAKIALWRLFRTGIRIAGFVHDEVICELPIDHEPADVKRIDRILCEAMNEVAPDIPITCDGFVSWCWAALDNVDRERPSEWPRRGHSHRSAEHPSAID